ncbi:unnamed protein product [Pedinophyceae sp. YPF-701]|nr:unnamed protein product [Pedinophyceae sp. YPF-701]
MHLKDDVLQAMGMGKVFKDATAAINALDFHRTEDLLVTSGDDDQVCLYNVETGRRECVVHSRKYGAGNICFTHHPGTVVYSSRKGPNHAVRYHALHDNRYLRYFDRHEDTVRSLAVSPINDLLISCGADNKVYLWDLRSPTAQGVMGTKNDPCAAFDEQGLIFAVATASGLVKMYDMRKYQHGEFERFHIADADGAEPTIASLRFSLDGKRMLAVGGGAVYVLDAFDGSQLCRVATGDGGPGSHGTTGAGAPTPAHHRPLGACFTPDGRCVMTGCEDRSIRVYEIEEGGKVDAPREVACWPGHAGRPTCVRFAPRRLLAASACQGLALWVPDLSKCGTDLFAE